LVSKINSNRTKSIAGTFYELNIAKHFDFISHMYFTCMKQKEKGIALVFSQENAFFSHCAAVLWFFNPRVLL
jgi:hypothetical protein